jgi:hypothetical protein
MSRRDDYEDEMAAKKLSDREIDQLLSGRPTGDERVAGLASLLQMLTDRSVREVTDDEVAAFAGQAAEIARTAGPSVPGRRALSRIRRVRLLRPRLATTLSLTLALGGMTGVAIASDDAAPGDRLYGLDRALEVIGIGDGAAAERIAEAQALFDGGHLSEALAHAASVAGNQGSQSADALRGAAEAVTSTDQGNADEVRSKVAEMLDWMATNATSEDPVSGSEFGEMVAGFAKGISGEDADDPNEPEEPEGTPGRPEGVPGGPPEDVPGGPPEGVTPGPPTDVPPRP